MGGSVSRLVGRVRLDRKGIGEVAKSDEVRTVVRNAAESVAAAVRARVDVPVDVQGYTTDRAGASVAVLGGDELQATEGILTTSAAAIGLEVTGR